MRAFLSATATLVCAIGVQAQPDAISTHFAHLEALPEVTAVTMSGKMFSMLGNLSATTPEGKSLNEVATQIRSMRLLAQHKTPESMAAQRKAVRTLSSTRYEEIAGVKDKDLALNIFVDEKGGTVSEVVFVAAGKEHFIVASLLGQISLQDVGKLAGMVASSQQVKLGADINPDGLNMYPNPARKGAEVTIEIPERMQGGTLRITDAGGREVHKQALSNRSFRVSVSTFGTGIYIVRLQKGDAEITRKLVIE